MAMPPADIAFVSCAELTPAQRLEAAWLARSALPDLFAVLDDETAGRILADQFAQDGTELSKAQAALSDGVVVGILAAYPAAETGARQGAGLHHLLSELPNDAMGDVLAVARRLKAGTPAGLGEGTYLARLAVVPDRQGSGLADLLMSRFIDGSEGPHSLHVRATNDRAIGFYRRHAFAPLSGANDFLAMARGA